MPLHASTRKPGRPKSPDIERRILRAAQAGFASRGFDGFAMDQLAWKAGMSKTTVYLHFRTKQELFKAALDNLLEQLPRASEMTSGITGDSLEERLVVVAGRASRLVSSAYFELIRRSIDADLPPSLREHVRAAAGLPYFQAIRDYLRDEAARGFLVFEDATSAASSFFALIAGPEVLRSRWSGSAFGPIDDAHLRYAVEVFARGHGAPPASATAFHDTPPVATSRCARTSHATHNRKLECP